jgi:outer membrane receptor protein involved in Fe transport
MGRGRPRRALGRGAAFVILLVTSLQGLVAAQNAGRIQGRVTHENGTTVVGVTVVLNETSATALTSTSGEFSFNGVPPGTYSLTFILGENLDTKSDVVVASGGTTEVAQTVAWEVGFSELLVVVAPSRRLERIVEAPAAVTRVTAAEIEDQAAHGQLPKLLEFTPGAEPTQSGLYDFNFNARGFNSTLNRRVATIIDGRNTSIPFLGSEEWAALSFPLDEVANLEFLRGPSAALYGANASSGVVNVTSKAPRDSPGGMVRATFGQLDTVNVDFRWAGALGDNWHAKAAGGVRRSGDFTVSRNGQAEYTVPCPPGVTGNCLPQERVPLARVDDNDIFFGSARVDKYVADGMSLAMEAGIADISGPVLQTGIGRVQVLEVQRPWGRVNFNSSRANLLASYTGRRAPRQLALGPGTNLSLSDDRVQFEGQTNWTFGQNKVFVVAGASAGHESIDSFDDTRGAQSLLFSPVDANQEAVFGQADINLTRRLKLVLAGRGDWHTLHDFQFSPKGSAVYTIDTNHSVRFTYNEAFQVPNYAEFFLQTDAAPPANLSALNVICAPFGVNCGFGPTRVLAVGNEDLLLEEISTWEVGYKGLLRGRALVTIDYYNSESSNFVTDLLPQLGTALGRVNPNFGPWEGPPGLPPPAVAQVRALAPPILSNNLDGSNVLVAASYANFGTVNTQGIDLGVDYFLRRGWRGTLSYSWFDFDIQNDLPGFSTLLLPNAPSHRLSAAVRFERGPFNTHFSIRWVDAFRWSVGPFQGDVPSYTTADLTAQYEMGKRVIVGLNVANLFDDQHWEAFGGDILRRRALVSVQWGW